MAASRADITVALRDALDLLTTVDCGSGEILHIDNVVDDMNRVYLTVNGKVFRITVEEA